MARRTPEVTVKSGGGMTPAGRKASFRNYEAPLGREEKETFLLIWRSAQHHRSRRALVNPRCRRISIRFKNSKTTAYTQTLFHQFRKAEIQGLRDRLNVAAIRSYVSHVKVIRRLFALSTNRDRFASFLAILAPK